MISLVKQASTVSHVRISVSVRTPQLVTQRTGLVFVYRDGAECSAQPHAVTIDGVQDV